MHHLPVRYSSKQQLLPLSLPLRRFKSTHTPTTFASAKKGEKTNRVSPPTSSTRFTAQPPPTTGPPRLIRHPAPDTYHSNYIEAPVSRFFAYRTSRRIQRSGPSSTSDSSSYLPNRKPFNSPTIEDDMAKSTSVKRTNGDSLRKRTAAEAEHKHTENGASSLFTHSHSHSHSHSHAEGSAEEADRLLAALKGKGVYLPPRCETID
jgi:hypothetical protein